VGVARRHAAELQGDVRDGAAASHGLQRKHRHRAWFMTLNSLDKG